MLSKYLLVGAGPLGVATALTALPGPASAQAASGYTPAGVYYEATGSGPPVVLIHAFSLDRTMWRDQIDLLDDEFRVIRYDLRGHGRSPLSGEPYAAYDDLANVLDQADVRSATLVGLSAGAQIAVDFALTYPDRVRGLVLAAPGVSGYVPRQPMTWARPPFEAAAAGDAERAARLWLETPLMTLRGNRGAASRLADIVMRNATIFSYRSNPDRPLVPPAVSRLEEVRSPTLVIVGTEDMAHIRDIADLLAADIDGAELIAIPGAGHIVNLDAPDLFNNALRAFLRR